MRKREKGFSLIELLIVVAIILIIAAIAIPNLLRSKMAANEASAVGSLRTITTAAISYSSIYGDGFPFTLAVLGGPATTTIATCDSALLVDSVLSTGAVPQKSGYSFTYAGTNAVAIIPAKCTNAGWNNFTVTAVPISIGSTGQRGFFVDETGVIRFTTDGTAPTNASAALQ